LLTLSIAVGFSAAFQDKQSGFCETYLHGIDVLVARSPAHYVSDIQKVKAVFKPELGSLKDVIIFPITGDVALAEKLSGGDYDGDMAVSNTPPSYLCPILTGLVYMILSTGICLRIPHAPRLCPEILICSIVVGMLGS
jgi:hypothetical protein